MAECTLQHITLIVLAMCHVALCSELQHMLEAYIIIRLYAVLEHGRARECS